MNRAMQWAAAWVLVGTFLVVAETPEERTLRKANVRNDNSGLLEFLRKRTPNKDELNRINERVRKLTADRASERTRAARELASMGSKAVPYLREAQHSGDREVVRIAREALARMSKVSEGAIVYAVSMKIRQNRPQGAMEALLAYLPILRESYLEDEIFTTIAALRGTRGNPDNALDDAFRSKNARQRAAAAWTLGRSTRVEDRNKVVSLLRDESAEVRFRAAEGLLAGKDRRGLSPLIEALTAAPMDVASRAELLLIAVAGANVPLEELSSDDEQRKKCQAAWKQWQLKHGAAVDLAPARDRSAGSGLRLVVCDGVREFGPDHRTRWQVKNVGGILDARALPGRRLLLADYTGKRITERDHKGTILWEISTGNDGPIEVQRLPDGNTLITTASEIKEVTPEKKVVYSLKANNNDEFFSAQKLPSGYILYGLASGMVVEQDPKTRETSRFKIEPPSGAASITVLGQGRYLIPHHKSNRIVEVNRDGHVQREIRLPSPGTVAVLPGNRYLVGSHALRSVREIDAAGKVLWEQKFDEFVYRVRSR